MVLFRVFQLILQLNFTLYVKLYQHHEKGSMKEDIFANIRFAVSERANFQTDIEFWMLNVLHIKRLYSFITSNSFINSLDKEVRNEKRWLIATYAIKLLVKLSQQRYFSTKISSSDFPRKSIIKSFTQQRPQTSCRYTYKYKPALFICCWSMSSISSLSAISSASSPSLFTAARLHPCSIKYL